LLVAIDGPAGAGKSTIARELARELGFSYLDSGAMYRCVGLLALSAPTRDPAELARGARIELRGGSGERSGGQTLLDGRDVSAEIRSPAASQAASRVARVPGVRAALVAKQRALIADGDWVAEGRDIGTVVAPDAELKVFLTASAEERARRRAHELGGEAEAVLAEQAERDARDVEREHSPLRAAEDAVRIDTTGQGVAQVLTRLVQLAHDARG
jgi:CMP/dCMP kinase